MYRRQSKRNAAASSDELNSKKGTTNQLGSSSSTNREARPPGSVGPFAGADIPVTKQRIGIIGAGMAGLYAALLLESLGFTEHEILEASPSRVGGRVFTRYFANVPKPKTWNYVDMGAMRFPDIKIMDRVIGSQPWSLTNYLNAHVKDRINLIDYHLSTGTNIQFYNSIRKTEAELTASEQEPDPLHFGRSKGGALDDKYVQEWYPKWLDLAFGEWKNALRINFDEGFRKLLELDHFSVRAFLRHSTKYPLEVIDYLETLDSGTGVYDGAVTETIMDSFDFDAHPEVQWKCVEGGTSRFADAMLSVIRSKPAMNKKVTKIAPSSSGDVDVFVAGEEKARTYRHIINTLPPAVVRTLDTAQCNFSYTKRTALRNLHIVSSVKVALLFKTRWWQDKDIMKGKPIKGGQSSTDLPIRTIVYPSYGIDDPHAAGVLIASYTWGQDASRLGCLAETDLVELAICNIATVHGLDLSWLKEQYTGQFFIQDWDRYEYSQGAFAVFGPGQCTSVFAGVIEPEMNGRYHTAGEMSSVHHAWIVGALNSAWRCVFEILKANDAHDKIEELTKKWGELEQVEFGDFELF